MYFRYISVILMFVYACFLSAQETDSLKMKTLDEVVVSGSYRKSIERNTALTVHWADKDFLDEHFTGNLMQTLEYVPGIHSMDIGSGFSKPMIRGMGFNRIVVAENGVKQEGQQWGADHGLEVDAFNVERVIIRKGPSSLLYGSDAMGGAIEIVSPPAPAENQVSGEAVFLGKSVNETFGGSFMLGIKKNAWHVKLRFSEQHFGDYRIPADTVVYLTQRLPVHDRRLKNTAGLERDASAFVGYAKGYYHANYAVSNAFQQVGFFPGAHGVPDASRLQDDGSSRNIDLPYSRVNHLKTTTRQQYATEDFRLCWDAGFQHNHREEWSLFHTHYGNQPAPGKEPNKELEFSLSTLSSSLKADWSGAERWTHTAGWDVQYQQNRIAGYSFLLPEYRRFTTGGLWLSVFRPNSRLSVSGGIRADYGKMNASAYRDVHLETYLRERDYPQDVIEAYKWRSYPVDRHFGDISGSLGFVWRVDENHLLKANVGRSFRLPGANELSSNGVHHGAFRHEHGDASLKSEQGWQADASYSYENEGIWLSASPFFSWFDNYIYLKPTGEWSILPHTGQIYRYTGAKALFAGAEIEFRMDLLRWLTYQATGEYVYTHNADEHTPMSFSPPASMRHCMIFHLKAFRFRAEVQNIAAQNRVAKNEDRTGGANLFHAGATMYLPVKGTRAEIALSAQNLFNTRYFNHLSFYRRVEIPEPGRNLQLLIKVPFKLKKK
ncbi:MAG: TonB-dependent receptor [Tannerella sp.]|nr:TonB-dependent receptor [Tannerella sp.]